MARQTINGSPGLYTAANAEILPPGSLAVAKGVVIRRPGLIQKARPWTQYAYGGDSTFTGTAYSIGFWLSQLYLTNNSGRLWNGTTTFTDSTYTVDKRLRISESNNNAYLIGPLVNGSSTTLGSTAKLTSPGATPYMAGCPRALDPILSSLASGSLLTSGQSRAYRAVCTLTDANGNYVFGAPSGPVTFLATGTQDVSAKVLLHADIYNAANATSYRVQLYASNIVASGSNPDDEMQLVADYGITAADVANKYVTIYDNTPDNLKGILGGAYLYTNPSQQTIAAANYQPPIANDIALFKGSQFYANTTQKHRASLTMIGPPEFWAVQAVSAADTPVAGRVTYTFLAAVDLTGIDNTMKLSVIGTAANNGEFPIVSVNNAAHTVVVTAAGGGAAGILGTAITGKLTAGNTSYFPIFGAESVASHYYTVPSTGTSQAKVSAATQSLVRIINQQTASNVVAYNTTSPLSPAGEMAFEEKSIGGTAFTVTAFGTTTAGYRGAYSITFSPAIPSATPLTSLNDAKKNRLHISKSGQPEHCPLSDSYYFDIGTGSAAILRLTPLRNALLVFKEDGLFRVTGDAGVFSWAPFDVTQVLLGEDLVTKIQNTAIAVTSRGFWQFTETSSRDIGVPAQNKADNLISEFALGRQLVSSSSRISATENDGVVHFVLAGTQTSANLAYCIGTGAWTEEWAAGEDGVAGEVSYYTMATTPVAGVRYGIERAGASFNIYKEDGIGGVGIGHQSLCTVTGGVFPSLTGATALGGPSFVAGQVLVDGDGTKYVISAVNGTTLTMTVAAGQDSPTFNFAAGTRYTRWSSQPIQIDYNPFSAGDDGGLNEFTEVAAILDPLSTTTASSVSIGCYTENWPAASMGMMPVPSATGFNRIGVEGAAQVARHISVRITHSNPLEYFYLRSVSYLFEPVEGSVATN